MPGTMVGIGDLLLFGRLRPARPNAVEMPSLASAWLVQGCPLVPGSFYNFVWGGGGGDLSSSYRTA